MQGKIGLRKDGGFSLLELIVVITIVSIMFAIVPAMSSKMVIFKRQQATMSKLQDLGEGFIRYYDLYGIYPTNISNFSDLVGENNPSKDAWDKDIVYYNNVYVSGVKYPAAFISGGKDGTIDSSISGSTLTLSPNDLYFLVTQGKQQQTNRYKTYEKLQRINGAYSVYLNTPSIKGSISSCDNSGSSECILDLYSHSLVKGTDCYDEWGHLFRVNSSKTGFVSCGPDGICNNSDDVS